MAESNINNTEKKRGRGRPAGAVNKSPFVRVRLGDIVNALNENYMVPVKATWAKEILDANDDEDFAPTTQTRANAEDDGEDEDDGEFVSGAVTITPPSEL